MYALNEGYHVYVGRVVAFISFLTFFDRINI